MKRDPAKLFLQAALAVLLLCLILLLEGQHLRRTACFEQIFPDQTLVLDAGHGGEDGGAVSSAGTVESEVNLAIVKKMDALCGFLGIRTELTRTDENSVHSSSAKTIRERKRSDILNRVNQINGIENAVLISVHQNKYTAASSHGAQVFYADAESSQAWAEQMQAQLVAQLDPTNTRTASKLSDSVYLMSHVTCPAILVECGFLSNPQEDALLRSDQYQTKLAAILIGGYLEQQTEGNTV